MEPCGMQSCWNVDPIDAVWSDWGSWSVDGTSGGYYCSAPCGTGYHQRVRTIEREASGGGAPVTGSFAEFKKCNTEKCEVTPIDCQFSEWEEWGAGYGELRGVQEVQHGEMRSHTHRLPVLRVGGMGRRLRGASRSSRSATRRNAKSHPSTAS